MHSSEQRAAEYASNTQHVEWVHQDVMFRLED